MSLGHTCPECGTSGWMHRDAERQRDQLRWMYFDVERLARDNGKLRYELDVAREADKREGAYLRRKVVKQAKVISKLEGKLRKRGQQPYDEPTT
jgi:ssDNA-binding Zn-finger/Zn-ribbon topoisomerase 1